MATREAIDRVFAMFHAEYGSVALERLASGVPDEGGADTGVVRARAWWHKRLRQFSDDVVVVAAQQSTQELKRFPATLPQLYDMCMAEERSRRKYEPYLPSPKGTRPPEIARKLARLREEAAERAARAEMEAIARGWK